MVLALSELIESCSLLVHASVSVDALVTLFDTERSLSQRDRKNHAACTCIG